jgi:hypothetical protein
MPDIDKAERRANRVRLYLLAHRIDPRPYRKGQVPLEWESAWDTEYIAMLHRQGGDGL